MSSLDGNVFELREDALQSADRLRGDDQLVDMRKMALIDEPFDATEHVPDGVREVSVVYQRADPCWIGPSQITADMPLLRNQMCTELIDLVAAVPAHRISKHMAVRHVGK